MAAAPTRPHNPARRPRARLGGLLVLLLPDLLALARQLAWAKEAAYPANRQVDETTQRSLLRAIETQTLFQSADGVGPDGPMPAQVVETVPLSQIGEDRLLSRRKHNSKGDAASDASESWVTLSSNASSNFTSVSGGSLDGELIGRFGVAL